MSGRSTLLGASSGSWSNSATPDTWRFITGSGDVPTLLTPTHGAGGQYADAHLDPQSTTQKYRVTIKKSEREPRSAARRITYANLVHADLGCSIEADEPFYWYVTTIDGNGAG